MANDNDADDIPRGSSSPGTPGFMGAISDAVRAVRKTFIDNPKREQQQSREDYENKYIDGDSTHDPSDHGGS